MNEDRPFIGIPTWSDVSQVYAGVPLSGINHRNAAIFNDFLRAALSDWRN